MVVPQGARRAQVRAPSSGLRSGPAVASSVTRAPLGSRAAPATRPAPPAPGPGGSLLRELGVDVAGPAPEARNILGGRLGFDTRDEARVAESRGRVEAAAEEAFFRAPGFDALPRPLGRQLFAAGLQSTPGRAADLLSIALAEAGTRPRKRRKTPGGASVRPTLRPRPHNVLYHENSKSCA